MNRKKQWCGEHFFKENGGKKGRMQRGLKKCIGSRDSVVSFLLFHFSFFCCGVVICRDGSRSGRICIKESKMKRTLRITSQGPVPEDLMCF